MTWNALNHSIERRTIDDSLRTMERIALLTSDLLALPLEQRAARRREIAREIALDAAFVYYLAYECQFDSPSDNAEVLERTATLMREIIKLRVELFLLGFEGYIIAEWKTY